MAGWTGLEPAASAVTGRRYNQLNYHPANNLSKTHPLKQDALGGARAIEEELSLWRDSFVWWLNKEFNKKITSDLLFFAQSIGNLDHFFGTRSDLSESIVFSNGIPVHSTV